jgi:hypothetical protein
MCALNLLLYKKFVINIIKSKKKYKIDYKSYIYC